MIAVRITESENVENKIDIMTAKSTISDNRDDQLEILLKQIAYIMSAKEGKNFKPKNRGGKFSKPMKQEGQVNKMARRRVNMA